MNEFAIVGINYNVFDAPFSFQSRTNTYCHLWCYYTIVVPQKHKDSRLLRGKLLPWGAYFCFVAWQKLEQQEAGDSLLHTFNFTDWPFGQTRYFTFKGTIAGIDSPSVGPIFTYTRPYLTSFPATLSSGFIRNRHPNYTICHDAASGDYIPPPTANMYILSQMKFGADYYIYRVALMFNLAVYPKNFKTVAARVKLKTDTVVGLPYDLILVSGLTINEPLLLSDYGNIADYPESFGSVACTGSDIVHYIYLNALGIAFIRYYPTLRLGLRTSLDVDSYPPIGPQLTWIWGAISVDRPWVELAYLPPK